MTFARSHPPAAVAACVSPCCAAKAKADQLSAAAAARIESLTGVKPQASGIVPGDDKPQVVPADASNCERLATQMAPVMRRFNRYREALPYAKAANDMNGRMGATASDPDKPVKAECLTRLPTDAAELNEALGLPAGTIEPRHLRQEETGFRAVLYRDETTGQLIVVPRDTQPTSLVDWQANTRNGRGLDTPQYESARTLASILSDNGVQFGLAGYSKGGGLAQEMALGNPVARNYVFNSSGLPENALSRTGASNFDSLMQRTQAFSAKDDFLTYMNTTVDPQQQLANAQFLQRELAGLNRSGGSRFNPMKIDHASPAAPDGSSDKAFAAQLAEFHKELDAYGKSLANDVAAGKSIHLFPPVRAGQSETIPGSDSFIGNRFGASEPGPNLGKLNQHLMSNVVGPMERNIATDQASLTQFLRHCK